MVIKHTPGPWRLTDDHGTRRVIKGGGPDPRKERTVCIIEEWTTEPDATLISAAPAMADALTAVWSELNELLAGKCEGGHPDIDDQARADLTRIRDGSRAALRAAGRLP